MKENNFFENNQYWIWPLLLGLILFAQQSWVPGFFHDGYLYSAFAKNSAELGLHFQPSASPNYYWKNFYQHPPFYFIIFGQYIELFGDSWSSLRLFNVLIVLLNLGVILYILRQNKTYALIAGLLFVSTPQVIKYARFPHMDFALSLFILLAIFQFYQSLKSDQIKPWVLLGCFSGFGFLIKGAPFISVYFYFFVYICISRQFKLLTKLGPWISAILGLGIFSTWFVYMSVKFNISIWDEYIVKQFFWSALEGRGNTSNQYFEYILNLFTKNPLHMIFTSIGLYLSLKKSKKTSLEYIFSVYFLSTLFLLSLASHKYSHYLIPLYSFAAIIGAFSITAIFKKKSQNQIINFYKVTTILVGLLLLIFPLTTSIRRDKPLHHLMSTIEGLKPKPKTWYVYKSAYYEFSIRNFLALKNRQTVTFIDHVKEVNGDNIVLIAPLSEVATIINQSNDLALFIQYKNSKIAVFVKKDFKNKFLEFNY